MIVEENWVKSLLKRDSYLTFEGSDFLQLIFNQICETRDALFTKENMALYGDKSITRESLRTFRQIFSQ